MGIIYVQTHTYVHTYVHTVSMVQAVCSLCGFQDHVDWHLLEEGDDGPPEVLVPVLTVHLWVVIVLGGDGQRGVVVEPA